MIHELLRVLGLSRGGGVGGGGVRIEVNIATRLRNLGSLLGFLT